MADTQAELRDKIKRALADARSDQSLLEGLSELAKDWRFAGFTYLWGPPLWQRNRTLFRPFILAHFNEWSVDDRGMRLNPWKGPHAPELEGWHRSADELDDVEVFRRLHAWRVLLEKDTTKWQQELVQRVRRAQDASHRRIELAKFEPLGRLDEDSAVDLYALDPAAATTFIRKHMVRRGVSWWRPSTTTLWERLRSAALARGDNEFAEVVYKRTAEDARWRRDALDAAEQPSDGDKLCSALRSLQIDWLPADAGEVFVALLRRRGRDVIPYVLQGLQGLRRAIYGTPKGYETLVELAWEKRWLELWAAALRVAGTGPEFNKQVKRLLRDSALSDDERRRCLGILAGVGREWNFGPFGAASIHPLEDPIATELYARVPELLRGAFKKHVFSGWHLGYPKLTDAVMDAHDEPLIDYLASRLVTRNWFGREKGTVEVIDRLSRHYEALEGDDAAFARRGATVLGQVPAFVVYNYEDLIKKNRLARVLWERRASLYLASADAVRDLLESPQIFTQMLAFRALSTDDDRARRLARDNLDLLCASLLRPLHRKTRFKAFEALWRAAECDEPAASRVLDAAMQAFALPDKRYPKEALIELVARIKHRYPPLRSAAEQPVIHQPGGAA